MIYNKPLVDSTHKCVTYNKPIVDSPPKCVIYNKPIVDSPHKCVVSHKPIFDSSPKCVVSDKPICCLIFIHEQTWDRLEKYRTGNLYSHFKFNNFEIFIYVYRFGISVFCLFYI